jgi:hypothetical protein
VSVNDLFIQATLKGYEKFLGVRDLSSSSSSSSSSSNLNWMSAGASLAEALLYLAYKFRQKEICGHRKKIVFLDGLRLECLVTW